MHLCATECTSSFNNLSELKQSNLNASTEDDYNTGGVTQIAGNKMLLYFDGSYARLEGQIRAGMSEMVINNLIYGSFGESFKNSTPLNFPEWYFEGLIARARLDPWKLPRKPS